MLPPNDWNSKQCSLLPVEETTNWLFFHFNGSGLPVECWGTQGGAMLIITPDDKNNVTWSDFQVLHAEISLSLRVDRKLRETTLIIIAYGFSPGLSRIESHYFW